MPSKIRYSMETKKKTSVNLEKQKGFFLLIGFVMILGFMFIAFEWAKQEITVYETGMGDGGPMDEDTIIITQRIEPPPPPAPEPPVIPPEIVIVENDVETESTDMINSETDKDEEIKPVVFAIEEKDEDVIFVAVEKNPEFPGGIEALYKFLGKEINYPPAEKEMGIQGRVICQFVVNTNGSIVDVVVVKGVENGLALDNEAIRVIKLMPKWIPGEQSKKKVRVKYTLPVVFKIQ